MRSILPEVLVKLPIFNNLALIVINFVVITLLITVFNHNKFKDKKSQIFVLMGIMMLVWVDSAFLARVFGLNSALSDLFLRVAWVATPMLFYFTYLTSIYVIKKDDNHKFVSKVLLALALLLSVLTAFTKVIIEEVVFAEQTLDIVYGIGFYPFLVAISVFIVATLAPLLKTRLNRSSKFFLIGVMIFYVANLIFNIGLPAFFGVTHLYYIGDYSTIFLLAFTSYAIIKHELFDIKVITTEALTVLIWIILFSKLFVSQSTTESIIDIGILSLMVVFGILLIRSVVREVKQRERLEVLTKKLKQLDEQKDEFISMAAHELRAPMTAIKGYLSMVMDGDAGEIPDKVKEFLKEATDGNDRLVRLVNNMLNVARIEEGRMVYQVGDVNLAKVAKTIHQEFKVNAKNKNLEFTLDIADNLKDLVHVDQDRIYEVVTNLVSNAIKYTDEGTVILKLSNPNEGEVKLQVIDTGRGVTEDEKNKLFGKFVRAKSSAGKTIGSGLGLYISKLLVEKFGGKIGIESTVDEGSTFWFDLPVRQAGLPVKKL